MFYYQAFLILVSENSVCLLYMFGRGAMIEKIELLEQLVGEMLEIGINQRVSHCRDIKQILSEIEMFALALDKRRGNFEEYKVGLIWHCEAMAGLVDNNGHSDLQHAVWAHGALEKIKSFHGLNIQ